MSDLQQERAALQETMTFLGAMASGIELAIGESAGSITFLAGKRLGMQLSAGIDRTADIGEALAAVTRVLTDNSCLWHFEPFQAHDQPNLVQATAVGEEIQLVFRDCMIRQSLFCFGHHQKGSLCNMMNGFFAGAILNIMGRQSTLEISHAGENACLKKLTIHNS